MERFRRNVSPPRRPRTDAVASGEGTHGKKIPAIGRAAGTFPTKLIASFRIVRRKGEQDKTSLFLAAVFGLPNELHIAILSKLSISDLLALRRTSRALRDLVSGCGPALVRFWVKRRFGSLHVKLYPPPGPDEAHFHYLLTVRRRHIASVRLTRELANYVLRGTLDPTSDRQRQLWTSVYEKMLPLVFAVGYFLEEHRRVVLERDLGRIRPRCHVGYDICTTSGITDAENDILKRLDQPLRLQYFYCYCFIVQVLMRKLRPPPCPVGKFVRCWAGQPACNEDVAFVLVLGGINQVSKLLACKGYSERRQLLHTFITRLSPHESGAWRSHWRDLGVHSPALLDEIPCVSIGVTQLDQIFEPLIRRLMKPEIREFTESQKARYEEVRSSKKYINEIMGYDILRGRPVEGEDSDAEDGVIYDDQVFVRRRAG